MNKAFSLLELIFAIVLIGIISAFAIPKYLNTKDTALATTIKRDIITSITSIQSYYLLNQDITSIKDAVILNEQNWKVENLKMTFKDCVDFEVKKTNEKTYINLDIKETNSSVCKTLEDMGMRDQEFDLM